MATPSGRLVLRRPTAHDAAAVFRLHGDPEANANNPSGPDADQKASDDRLAAWLDHWDKHGFGFWTVEAAGNPGTVIGFGGVRHDVWRGEPVLNLYYRFDRECWGRGYAHELAMYSVAWAHQALPGVTVLARTVPGNEASQRTALGAGLVRRSDLDAAGGDGYGMVFADRDEPTRCDGTGAGG